jgi:hypothetical protein
MSGTNSSHTPVLPSTRIGWLLPFQPLKSPITRTPACSRRPDGEGGPGDRAGRAVVAPHVGPEHGPQLLVPALGDQVQVDLASVGR